MMPKILREWGSLKMRKAFRKLTGAKRPESAVLARTEAGNGHACINGAIQQHNATLLNGSAHPNGAIKPTDEARL